MRKFTSKNILISGITGSGKSNFLHRMIIDLLNANSPDEVRLILIDPKRVEFSIYDNLPYLLSNQAIVDTLKAINAFKWAWAESMTRLKEIDKLRCSSIEKYNKLKYTRDKFPQIYIIIDEFSDLMCYDKKFFEEYVEKITATSKLTGIYLIVSTSRPCRDDVFTKKIVECFFNRIAFRLAEERDSIYILGERGAEKLLGAGNFLFKELLESRITRQKSLATSDKELRNTIEVIKNKYADFKDRERDAHEDYNVDDLFPYAKEIAREKGLVSASLLQRKLNVGYSRAAALLDLLEKYGFVESADGIKPRKYIEEKNSDQWIL